MFHMPYDSGHAIRKVIVKQVAMLLLPLTSFALAPLASAAKLEPGVTRSNVPYVNMTGEIVRGDAQQFRYILEQWAGKNAPIQILDLNSPGGSLYEAYLMLQSVLDYKVSTIVMPGNHCISACVSIFASGKERFADPQSTIGVHRANIDGVDSNLARSISINMIDLYDDLGIPDNIQLRMIKTPPAEVYYLSQQDKLQFNQITPNTAAAINTIQKTNIKTPEKNVTQGDRKLARTLNTQGIELINQRQYIQAINVLEQSKGIYPTDAEVLGNLGYAYYMAGNLDSAQNDLTSALHLMPSRGATWNNLGLVLVARGDVVWAAESFVKYWNYSRNKKVATNQFFYWESMRPGTTLEQASRMARSALGITAPVK